MSNRERVALPDDVDRVQELMYGGKDEDWKLIQSDIMDTDLEKAAEEIRVIIKRKSDDKLFSFMYNRTQYHSLDEVNDWPLQGREVFPKQVMRTIYE